MLKTINCTGSGEKASVTLTDTLSLQVTRQTLTAPGDVEESGDLVSAWSSGSHRNIRVGWQKESPQISLISWSDYCNFWPRRGWRAGAAACACGGTQPACGSEGGISNPRRATPSSAPVDNQRLCWARKWQMKRVVLIQSYLLTVSHGSFFFLSC